MTKKERLLQDIDYAIKHKIDKFYIKTEVKGYKGLCINICCNCDFKRLQEHIANFETDNLRSECGRIVSWGEFSVNEDKHIKDVVLGDELGEDIYV